MVSLLDGVTDKKFKEYYIKYCFFYNYEIEDVANLIRYIETVLSCDNISDSWTITSINLIDGEYIIIDSDLNETHYWNYREDWGEGEVGALKDFILHFNTLVASCNPF